MKIKTIAIIAISLIVGAAAGFLWASNAFKKFEIAKEVDVASVAAMNAGTLAQLRLDEATNAISSLESEMYLSMQAMATWDRVLPPDKTTRERRDRWLTSVKVYYQSYPPHGEGAAEIISFLEKIPGRGTNSACKGAICRLDDLRLAGLKMTNAAAK
jgi:hypothetical protein